MRDVMPDRLNDLPWHLSELLLKRVGIDQDSPALAATGRDLIDHDGELIHLNPGLLVKAHLEGDSTATR